MKFAKFFSLRAIKEQAKQLAEAVAKDVPPKIELTAAKTLSVNRVTTILERTYTKAQAFQKDQPMGFIKRAVFGNTFRWRLKELGYSDKFVEIATEGLIVKLSSKDLKQK